MQNAAPMWMIRVGWCLIVVGAASCLSPLLDLLPVEVWEWLSRTFLPENSPNVYYRIVPSESNVLLKAAVVALGAFLVAWGSRLRSEK